MNFFDYLGSDSDTLLPVEFYFRSFKNGFAMSFHSHKTFEFMYAESGHFTVAALENGEEVDYDVYEGGFIFIHSEIPHKLIVTENVKICNLELLPAALSSDYDIKIFSILHTLEPYRKMKKDATYALVLNDTENMLTTFAKIHQILKNYPDDQKRNYQLQALTLSLFIDLSNCYINSKYQVDDLYVSKALRLIHKNIAANLTPKQIALKLKISESYLFRIFKRKTNCTITYYVNQVRIEKAKQLLIKTSHPIVNIGAEIGFNNRQHFCKVFSAFTGLSPSEYRKQQKESEYTMLLEQKMQTFFDNFDDI